MADGTIAIDETIADKRVDTTELVVSGQTVQRERIVLAGEVDTQIAGVTETDPLPTEYGLVTRPRETVNPVSSSATSANLAAGAAVDLDSAAIAVGTTGKLMGVTLSSSVAAKWVIKERDGAAETTIDVVFTSGLAGGQPSFQWRPPTKDFHQLAGDGR